MELRIKIAGGDCGHVVGQNWTLDWQLGEVICKDGVPGSALTWGWSAVPCVGETTG